MSMEAIEIVDRMIADLERMPERITKAVAVEGLAYAISQSSGWMSLAELADEGHPYSRRHGGSLLFPPDQTNVQSGEFVESWDAKTAGRHGVITNTAPVADVLVRGTEKMVERRIDLNVKEHVEAFILPWEIQNAVNAFNERFK